MSYYQISSGSGPSECELAVAKFLDWLAANYENIEVIDTAPGYERGTFKSAFIKTDADLSEFIGTLQWICKSPFRPNHKRKNWFINFRAFSEKDFADFDESKVVFQTMRAGGHGGQNVNKVETAVRATYTPTGFSTVCQDERSQLMNKKRAIERIKLHLLRQKSSLQADEKKDKWSQHNNLQRGDAVASFGGEKFQRE